MLGHNRHNMLCRLMIKYSPITAMTSINNNKPIMNFPRGRMLLKLLFAFTSLFTIGYIHFFSPDFFANTSIVSIFEWGSQKDNAKGFGGVQKWHPSFPHPSFPHSHQTAYVEIEVPSVGVTGVTSNGMHRRLQSIQGEAAQEPCPASHTLISQSLILRSSYGNIFSITTPDNSNSDNESINNRSTNGVETITIQTLSLRMADYRPNETTHFEVWLFTGSGDEPDYELNENDLDDDLTNDNSPGSVPSRGDYQASRAKFTDWQLISEGEEKELVPDTEFFDNNGHIFNTGTGTTIGPLGDLNAYENMEEVTIAAQEWNAEKLRVDGGMDVITAEGEVAETYFFKIPEEKFTPLKLPKYNGKLTLFVTLDRVGLQYGYAAKREFDEIDVMKHEYTDQTPSLDELNDNVNLQMRVGEGVIFYPWMEEEFFYQTRRFLGKIWYDAKIPCEYVNYAEVMVGDGELTPPTAPSIGESESPSLMPSMEPSRNGTSVTAAILISVLIKYEKEPMPDDVKEIFEKTILEFVNDSFGDFCPLVWNEDATVTEQELSPIGGTPSGASSEDPPDDLRKLLEVLEPIFFSPPKPSRSRLLQAITALDATTSIEALYSSPSCLDKTPEDWASILESYINDNQEELLDRLKAAHDYFKDAFGVSADVSEAVGSPTKNPTFPPVAPATAGAALSPQPTVKPTSDPDIAVSLTPGAGATEAPVYAATSPPTISVSLVPPATISPTIPVSLLPPPTPMRPTTTQPTLNNDVIFAGKSKSAKLPGTKSSKGNKSSKGGNSYNGSSLEMVSRPSAKSSKRPKRANSMKNSTSALLSMNSYERMADHLNVNGVRCSMQCTKSWGVVIATSFVWYLFN